MAGTYKRLSGRLYCTSATHLGYSRYDVGQGDLILFREGDGQRLGRVLGLATHDGCGQEYRGPARRGKGTRRAPRLLVLAANDTLSHGFERHVALEDVLEVPRAPGDFARFFLFGIMPDHATAIAMSEYGAMSDSYLGRYLDGGHVAPDWRARTRS